MAFEGIGNESFREPLTCSCQQGLVERTTPAASLVSFDRPCLFVFVGIGRMKVFLVYFPEIMHAAEDRLARSSWQQLVERWEAHGWVRRETNPFATDDLAVLREQIVLTSTGWRFIGREGSVSRIPVTTPRHLHEIQRAATRLLTNHPDADWVTEARVRSLLARRRAELDRRGLGKDRQDHIPDGVLVRTGKQGATLV